MAAMWAHVFPSCTKQFQGHSSALCNASNGGVVTATHLCSGRNERRLLLEEQTHHFGMVLLGGEVDRLPAELVRGIRVGAQLDEEAAHFQLALAGGQLQCRLLPLH